jgi:ABC-type sugar transport system ATPase subunit
MAELSLRQVRKRFDGAEVVKGVDLDVADREFVVFVGPSGCGKSTLLRMIAGLEEISDGEIAIAGERVNEIEPADRGVAMVFQSYALYPHLSVYENMSLGLRMAGVARDEIDRRVRRGADILRIGELLDRRPRQLSGGQRQRVAIGRAIVKEPQVFLFDEPLSNLDAELRVQMRVEINNLHRELGSTMVYVTHDQEEAMTMADRIVVLRLGNVEQIGAPMELYRRPANRFVAGFIGSPRMNFVEVDAIEQDGSETSLALPGGARLGVPRKANGARPAVLGVRPEHLRVVDGQEGPQLAGEVYVVEHLGAQAHLHVRLGDGTHVVAVTDGETDLAPGRQVGLQVPAAAAHLFDAEGLRLS